MASLHDLSTGGRSEADQPVVLWIVLLALFEDELKTCLSPVLGISPISWPFSSFVKSLSALSTLESGPLGPTDLSGKKFPLQSSPQLVVPPLLEPCLVAKGLGDLIGEV